MRKAVEFLSVGIISVMIMGVCVGCGQGELAEVSADSQNKNIAISEEKIQEKPVQSVKNEEGKSSSKMQQAKIATFNTLHLGWGKNKNYARLAEIISNFDVVGLEEVMSEAGLEELTRVLNEKTQRKWNYHMSDKKVGRSKYKEFYGYVYNDNAQFLESEGFYPDSKDVFERDPYAASFKLNEFDFTFVTCHSVFGDSKSERMAEASYLDDVYSYYQGLDNSENDIFIGGDYNLPANDQSFDLVNIDQITYALKPVQKTSIGKSGLSSAYDNIFYSKYTNEILDAGVYDFTNNDYASVRKSISDHIPVYVVIDTSIDDDGIGEKTNTIQPVKKEIVKETVMEPEPVKKETATSNGSIKIESVDLGDEVVIIKNNGNDVDMTGWTIVSKTGNQKYNFPESFILKSNTTVQIVSGQGKKGNGKSILKWSGSYIWNNDGDICEIYNDKGTLVDRFE
jgi:endonuclease/exonuclease/phosphatase family metal-dependent hydrolase